MGAAFVCWPSGGSVVDQQAGLAVGVFSRDPFGDLRRRHGVAQPAANDPAAPAGQQRGHAEAGAVVGCRDVVRRHGLSAARWSAAGLGWVGTADRWSGNAFCGAAAAYATGLPPVPSRTFAGRPDAGSPSGRVLWGRGIRSADAGRTAVRATRPSRCGADVRRGWLDRRLLAAVPPVAANPARRFDHARLRFGGARPGAGRGGRFPSRAPVRLGCAELGTRWARNGTCHLQHLLSGDEPVGGWRTGQERLLTERL